MAIQGALDSAKKAAKYFTTKDGLKDLGTAGGLKLGKGTLSFTGKVLKLGTIPLAVYAGDHFIIDGAGKKAIEDAFENPAEFFNTLGETTETLADGATKLSRETAQIGADTWWEGLMARLEKIATGINAIGGANNGMSLDILNFARGQQTGKPPKVFDGKGLVVSNTNDEIYDSSVDKNILPSTISNAFTRNGLTNSNDVNAVLDQLVNISPEFKDEAEAIKNDSTLKDAFVTAVIAPAGTTAANAADFHHVLSTGTLKHALGMN